jgi:hypothetical protein
LFRKESIDFVNNGLKTLQRKDVHVRLKIYNNDGFSWATDKVVLFHNEYREEKIRDLEGATYTLINNEIKKTELGKDGIFEEDLNKNLKSISFTFPNVKKGSVIDYKYSIVSPFYSIDDVDLQYTIPVKKLDVHITTSKRYKYNKILNPKSNYLPKIIYPNLSKDKGFQPNYDRVISISENNIPALREEPFSGNINNYKAKLSFEMAGVLTQYGGLSRDFSASWEQIAEDFSESRWFGEQAKKKSVYKKELNLLLEETNEPNQVIDKIQTYIKSKVRWNGFYGRYVQKGVREAYTKGEGNVVDINLLLVSMLRSRGLNANPVVLSTRSNGVPLFPTDDGLNYVICVVEIDGENILLDATEKFAPNNLLPERVLNWQGLKVMEDGTYEWIDLKTKTKSVESTALNVKINEDNSVTGKVRKNMTSYKAFNYRKKYADLSAEEHLKSLEADRGDFEIDELEYLNEENINKPVKLVYNYELLDGLDEVGDKLYFTPLLFLATKENVFKLDKRVYPIDFITPYHDNFMISIMFPEGYKIESMPKSEVLDYKNGEAKFEYISQENGVYLQFRIKLEINNPIVEPAEYSAFKAFFSKIVEKQAEQIVLTKD